MGPRARGRARGDDAVDVPGARTATTTTTTREEDDESDADATARARPTAMKSSTARADSLHAPSEDDVALAYDVLDPKSRGFFTARDVQPGEELCFDCTRSSLEPLVIGAFF